MLAREKIASMTPTMWMIASALLLCFFGSSYGQNMTKPKITECNTNVNHTVKLADALGMDGNKTMYPLKKSEKGVLEIKLHNMGKEVRNVLPQLRIWKRVSIFGHKKWMPIPTFGYL
ncbi:hypothetical protein M514_09716 [Trichuris suis]|uniref:Uncharacterized protein n=1 Tax=Trichuris suis TaxID=68888 RepID=A0A085N2G9_9BILA|nr:hypothetical protein M513_09716 [Trichuris suis]KFD63665.1 hypothetical protein M514_09716 [Trichuris suis]